MRITWSAPGTGGSTITAYSILIQKSDGQFVSESSFCDGTSPSIRSTRTCDIPFTVLRDPLTFNLQQDDYVVVKISAVNVIGMGPYSTTNALEVSIETEPAAPSSAPQVNSYSETEVELELADSRRLLSSSSAILFYELVWDQGTNGATWTSYTVTNNNIISVTGLSSGVEYQFKYRL